MFYRQPGLITLIYLMILALGCPLACIGQALADDTEDWPDPVYFPQNVRPTTTRPETSASAAESAKPASTKPEKVKKPRKGLHFRRRNPIDAMPTLTDEQITQVGPKDPPPSPFPLLRVTMPILSDTGIVPTGIYLLRPMRPPTAPAKAESPDKPVLPEITVALTRQSQIVMKCRLRPMPKKDENLRENGTPSPLSKANPKLPEPTQAELRFSPDQRTVIIVLKEAGQIYESDPFPLANDQRHLLTY